ncbi:MAG: hypothetical protein AAF361_16105 [Bacteroidota bacterium]
MPKPKTYLEFRETLSTEAPPELWPEALQALWWDAKGNWGAAHDIIEDLYSNDGSWVHAYLHRKEGDQWNAGYWYRRANKPYPEGSLEEELEHIVSALL